MKTSTLRATLVLSLLVNLGVLGALGYRALQSGDSPSLVQQLTLDAEQQRHWHEAETIFLAQFAADSREIRQRRDRLITRIFAVTPDTAAIEVERNGIASLQDRQQKLVIAQLLKESKILDEVQRKRLAQLLMSQPIGPSTFESLHRN